MVSVGDLVLFKKKSFALVLGIETWEDIDKNHVTYEVLVKNRVQYVDLKKSNTTLIKVLNSKE
jgi:hypothetical protein